MASELFSQLLGGGILFEDNPYYSTATAQTCLDEFQNADSPEIDVALSIEAIIALKSGDFYTARKVLNRIKPDDECASFTFTQLCLRILLENATTGSPLQIYGARPCHMLSSLDKHAQTSVVETRTRIFQWCMSIEQAGKEGKRQPFTPQEWLETRLLLLYLEVDLYIHGFSPGYNNPDYPIYRATAGPLIDQRNEYTAKYLQTGQQFSQFAESLTLKHALKYIDIVALANEWCEHGKISPDSIETLSLKYETDALMRGHIAIMGCDSILSPAWASPILLNTCPVLTFQNFSGSDLWSRLEDNMQLINHDDARMYLEQAAHAFEHAGCTFGEAAVYIRYACLEYGVSLSKHGTATVDELDEALSSLDAAYVLLDGNVAWQLIVCGHRIVIATLKADFEEAHRQTMLLHHQATALENHRILQEICTFLLRVGRRQVVLFSRSDSALALWTYANILGRGYSCDVLAFIATSWKVSLYNNLKNEVQAYVSFKNYHEELFQLFERLDGLPTSDRDGLASLKVLMLTDYQSLSSQVLNLVGDFDMLSSIKEKEQQLVSDRHLFEALSLRSKPSESIPDLNEFLVPEGQLEKIQAVHQVYSKAQEQYFEYLDRGEIEKAKQALQDFVRAHGDQESALNSLYAAYLLLEDFAAMRRILDSDSGYLNRDYSTIPRLGNGAVWSRTQEALSFNQPGACDNALAFHSTAKHWVKGNELLTKFEIDVSDYLSLRYQHADKGYRLTHGALILEHAEPPNYLRAFEMLLRARSLAELAKSGIQDSDRQLETTDLLYTAEILDALARLCIKLRDLDKRPSDNEIFKLEVPNVGDLNNLALYFADQRKAESMYKRLQEMEQAQNDNERNLIRKRRLLRSLSGIPKKHRSAVETQELGKMLEDSDGVNYEEFGAAVFKDLADPRASLLQDDISMIPSDALLIIINYGNHGKIAIGVTHEGVQLVEQRQDYIRMKIRDAAVRTKHLISSFGNEPASLENLQTLQDDIDFLSEEMLGPFRDLISKKQHVVFSMTAPATSFPYALLQYDSKPLFLSKAISTTPSLKVFAQLCRRQSRLNRQKVALVTRPATKKEWTRTQEAPLPMAAIESVCIAASAPSSLTKPISSAEVDRENFISILSANDIVHIGTHGHIHKRSPWLSSVSARTQLRVLDVAGATSRCGLIVLAACSSGLGKQSFTEEAIGFAHTLLSGCANAMIGSLWKVDDVGTMFLMIFFYEELWACESGISLAEVLRRAQVRLRNVDSRDKVRLELSRLKECISKAREIGIEVDAFVNKPSPEKILDKAHCFDDGFSHPFFWSSFQLMGNGTLQVGDSS